jgi:hypothetical protein
MSSNSVHGEVYSIQHYVIKFVSDLKQVSGFLRVLLFPPPIKTDSHDITEILLKEELNTINQTMLCVHVLWTHSNIFFTFKLINLCSYLYWTLYTVLQTLHPLLEDGCHDDEETDPQKKVCILQILLKFSGFMIW